MYIFVGVGVLAGRRRLLVLGPSFRRRCDAGLLPALERFDGLFFRVARKYLGGVRDVDVVITDDLTLVDGDSPLAYRAPEGGEWGKRKLSREVLERARVVNERFLEKKLRNGRYGEVYLAMGKQYAAALPDLAKYGVKVVFPTSVGPGPKAQALKQWILERTVNV
ncbi:MAG: hypothetical protein QXI56_05855 [Candidatus Bathyarchaeia archaeon]